MTLDPDQPRAALLSRVAFGLALVILIARSLMLEVVRDVGVSVATAPAGPGVATSVFLDWLSLLPALLILIRRLVDRSYALRFASCHWLFFALAAWAILSTAWADDRFLALVTSTRLLAASSLFWSFAQLVRRWDHVRVIAGVVLGLLLANVAQGVLYRTVEFADLQQFWETNKAQIFQERGWQPGDYAAGRFEMKLLAGELLGFNASPNVLGALVVLMTLVGLGAAAQRMADRDEPGFAGLTLIASLSGLYLLAHAGSKAAWGALLLGVALLALVGFARRALVRQRAMLFAAISAAILLGIVSVVAVGLSRGDLFDASLTFRWRYWLGAWPLFLNDPAHGIGWSNFADHYLATRLPEAAEEINDPHNFLVRLAVELGFVGIGLFVAGSVAWAWRATMPRVVGVELAVDATSSPSASSPPLVGLAGILVTCAVALAFSIVVSFDVLNADAAYLLLEVVKRCLLVGLITLAVAVVAIRSAAQPHVDARPAPWIAGGLLVGLAMLLLQSTIDVTFFQTGPLILVATIAGALLGIGWRDGRPKPESLPLVALIVGGLGWVVMLVILVVPVAIAESMATSGNAAMTQRAWPTAITSFRKARFWSPVANFDYALREADAAARLYGFDRAGEARADPRERYDAAIAAAPRHSMSLLSRGRFLTARPDVPPADAQQALDDFARAVELNPNEVDIRLEYADLLERFGRPAEAAAQLFAALAINAKFDPNEPERLELRSPGRREAIAARAAALQARAPVPSPL